MLFIGNRIAYCILTARNSASRPSPRNWSICIHSHCKHQLIPFAVGHPPLLKNTCLLHHYYLSGHLPQFCTREMIRLLTAILRGHLGRCEFQVLWESHSAKSSSSSSQVSSSHLTNMSDPQIRHRR